MSDARAQSTGCLEERIRQNKGSQKLDFIGWIFDGLDIAPDASVLELCCGTGNQTRALIDRIGDGGRICATDISESSLEKLTESLAKHPRARQLTTRASDMDAVGEWVAELGPLDLIFCSYGLYYSQDPMPLVDRLRAHLSPRGRVVVVGPFGPNNRELFDLLEGHGVTLAQPVTYSSGEFMDELARWGSRRFQVVTMRTVSNPVAWSSADDILSYWKNTTFYEEDKLRGVEASLRAHFAEHAEWTNTKWIMRLEMAGSRE